MNPHTSLTLETIVLGTSGVRKFSVRCFRCRKATTDSKQKSNVHCVIDGRVHRQVVVRSCKRGHNPPRIYQFTRG